MLKKIYILNFIIDAKFNIQKNKIFVISVVGLGGVESDSAWRVIPPSPHGRNTA
jgi:hypothetical protein